MQELRKFIAENLEKLLVLLVLVGVVVANLFVVDKLPFLSFYYLPVLLAAWGCGRRTALLVSILSVFLVVLYLVAIPSSFDSGLSEQTERLNNLKAAGETGEKVAALEKEISHRNLEIQLSLVSWGAFLVLAAALIGTLYEVKERQAQELKQAYVGILEILTKCLECTERHVLGHSQRVADLAAEIAEELHLSDAAKEKVRVGGLLHDIGKVDVSLRALEKSAELTDEEREEIGTHPARGAEILESAEVVLRDVIPIVRLHHQHSVNGEIQSPGLPKTKLDKELSLEIGIIAVADAYDAIVSDRPYRPGKVPLQALREIESHAGTQFDEQVVEALKRLISRKT